MGATGPGPDPRSTATIGRPPAGRSLSLASARMFARLIDAKDPATRHHSERSAVLVEGLALACGWAPERAEGLREAALLHDIGKIGVPDAVLLKPAPLSPIEYETVKAHAELGASIVADLLHPDQTGWVRSHHERWDGRGYPDGIAGEEIPEGARLLAVAEAWDTMTQARAYRAPLAPAEALAECERTAGRQFWPVAVRAMRRVVESGSLSGRDRPGGQR